MFSDSAHAARNDARVDSTKSGIGFLQVKISAGFA